MVTDQQVRKLTKQIKKGKTMVTSSFTDFLGYFKSQA